MVVETSIERLGRALNFYQTVGFEYAECPWMVDPVYLMATCPHERYMVNSDVGALVGSAEQSFIALDAEGGLPPGRYVGYTPCFRPETEDHWHQKGFNKVELYRTDSVAPWVVMEVLSSAMTFFKGELHRAGLPTNEVTIRETGDGFDLEIAGVEVGSYGKREWTAPSGRVLKWVYGTGCAEPRLTKAIDRLNLSRATA